MDTIEWARAALPGVTSATPVAGYDVVRLCDDEGWTWYAKSVTTDNEFDAEVHAYERWGPHLADAVPQLVTHDRTRRALLLRAAGPSIPSTSWSDPDVHRRAGAFLRRLHDTPSAGARSVALTYQRGRESVLEVADLLTSDEVDFVLECIERLDRLPAPPHVASHGDFAPWNWHDAPGGRLGVVDFGHAGAAPAAADLVRLYVDSWWGRPDLVQAFLAGYGRRLASHEKAWLRLSAPPTLARDLRHVVARGRPPAVVAQKRERLRALHDGRLPALPRPLPRLLEPWLSPATTRS